LLIGLQTQPESKVVTIHSVCLIVLLSVSKSLPLWFLLFFSITVSNWVVKVSGSRDTSKDLLGKTSVKFYIITILLPTNCCALHCFFTHILGLAPMRFGD